jgi:hypothetical protein
MFDEDGRVTEVTFSSNSSHLTPHSKEEKKTQN